MSFIQIIEYETDRPEELAAEMNANREAGGDAAGFVRFTLTQDRDNPKRYLALVEFSSYEVAMANSGMPETDAMARRMTALVSKGPTYHNLDVVATDA